MKVFKFGGASVKDAKAIKNVVRVLKNQGISQKLVVISAMGKMTNAFEDVIACYYNNSKDLQKAIQFIEDYHYSITKELFDDTHEVFNEIALLFGDLSGFFVRNKSRDYNFIYDQIIGYGELLSTKIVSAYLNEVGLTNNWIDVRDFIKTDTNFRAAKVNWYQTQEKIKAGVNINLLNITQGFLGGNNNDTTTLGREGSDYTAGIFAYCLDAESVTIWKDVEGVLNADPRVFKQTQLLTSLSYTEAIEMAFYGASVIHPKTIQPLEQKNIPLYVRSFDDLQKEGTCVCSKEGIVPKMPCFIVKNNQILLGISAKDFSFMVEENISYLFKKLHDYQLKVNLIQNSAISFYVCIEDQFSNFSSFFNDLENTFKIQVYNNVKLYTVRHFNQAALEKLKLQGETVLSQVNTNIAQLVIKSKL